MLQLQNKNVFPLDKIILYFSRQHTFLRPRLNRLWVCCKATVSGTLNNLCNDLLRQGMCLYNKLVTTSPEAFCKGIKCLFLYLKMTHQTRPCSWHLL